MNISGMYPLEGNLGMCFPSSCSPAEIIIATVAEATIENTNDFPVRAWGEDVIGGIPLSHSQVHDGLWYRFKFT